MNSRRAVLASVAVGVLLVGGAAAGWLVLQQRREADLDRAARAVAASFAHAWEERSPGTGVRYAGLSPSEVAAGFTATTAGLGNGKLAVGVQRFDRTGDRAQALLSVSWGLPGGVAWAYQNPVALARAGDSWVVQASTSRSLWHPALSAGQVLTATRTSGKRGDVLDRDGKPLLAVGTVYDVQIDPARATTAAVTALEPIVGEPAGSLLAKLRAAQQSASKATIPVISYRAQAFASLEPALAPLPGVIYPKRQQPLAATRTFGQPLLGSYGAVTAEMVTKGGGRYLAGDFAGLSGIQGQYDAVLRGTSGVSVSAGTAAGSGSGAVGGSGAAGATADVPPLFVKPATDGADVRLALRSAVQAAAENALAGTGSVPSALVAVDVKSGDVLAVANSPATGFDRALQGQYQPGSTLKVATTYGLLRNGLSPSTPVSCPKTTVVDGMSVRNYEGETLGAVSFAQDFAHSCNTAFVQLAAGMADSDVRDAALELGVGADWAKTLGVAGAYAGSVPAATSKTEKAATAFGQAKTLTSPAALAVMAGSVARGSFVAPAVVTSPAAQGADRMPKPLNPSAVSQLRSLMRLVVTDGTATGMRSVTGGAVFGKTGTAEYGPKSPPDTRAWFVGWQGDIAFSVLVEQGKSGGTVAVPIAKAFLEALP